MMMDHMREINPALLLEALRRKNVVMVRESEKAGFCRNYLSGCIFRRRIDRDMVQYLRDYCGIPPEEYLIDVAHAGI